MVSLTPTSATSPVKERIQENLKNSKYPFSNSEQTIMIENEGGEIEGAENEGGENEGGDRNSKDNSTEKPPTFNQSSLNDNVYRCNCGKLCQSRRGLSQHMSKCNQEETVDSSGMVIHSCDACNSKFNSTRALTQHRGSKTCAQRLEASRVCSNSLTLALTSSSVFSNNTGKVKYSFEYLVIEDFFSVSSSNWIGCL